jgi:hypothetical protein
MGLCIHGYLDALCLANSLWTLGITGRLQEVYKGSELDFQRVELSRVTSVGFRIRFVLFMDMIPLLGTKRQESFDSLVEFFAVGSAVFLTSFGTTGATLRRGTGIC